MSHKHHYHSLFQKAFFGAVDSLGNTQSSHIVHTYRSYVGDAPFAYFAYATMAMYFAYRCTQAYSDRALRIKILNNKSLTPHEEYLRELEGKYDKGVILQEDNREVVKSSDFYMRLKQNDQWAILLGAFASLTALNWSVAPIIKANQYFALLGCVAAEYAFYTCGSNFNNRQNCRIIDKKNGKGDSYTTIIGKCFTSIPFVNLIAETVTGKMPFDRLAK